MSYSSSFCFGEILVFLASNSSVWNHSSLELTSSSCCLIFLFSARSALAFAFAREQFAHLSETFRIFSWIDTLLFCCSTSAVAKSTFHGEELKSESVLSSQVSVSLWIPIDVVLIELDFFYSWARRIWGTALQIWLERWSTWKTLWILITAKHLVRIIGKGIYNVKGSFHKSVRAMIVYDAFPFLRNHFL